MKKSEGQKSRETVPLTDICSHQIGEENIIYRVITVSVYHVPVVFISFTVTLFSPYFFANLLTLTYLMIFNNQLLLP
jgi:hypothetical protein